MRIITACQRISPHVTVKGFKECCISNAMDETDDMLQNCSEENGNVRSECEEHDDIEYKNGDSDTDW